MPRLELRDDDGRLLFSGQVAQRHVDGVAAWLHSNMATLRTLATGKRALEDLVAAAHAVLARPRPRPRRLKGR